MSRWVRAIGLSLLAVMTAACANKVGGVPVAAVSPTHAFDNPDKITAEDALGELTKWNPCSVVDPGALPKAWSATLAVPVAFEDCGMSVTYNGTYGEVQVGYLYEADDLDSHTGDERDGGITVVPDDTDKAACARNIVFADGIGLVVRTWSKDEDADDDTLCEISDGVVDAVLDDVMAGKAQPLELPDKSVGEIDPCQLVTTDLVTLVPGITADVKAEEQVSGHSCWWAADGGQMLNVEFEIGTLPVGDSGETVQGRYTALTQYADDDESSVCAIDGEHVPFEFGDKHGLMERVSLSVYQLPGQVEQACAAGKQLANALWQKLPPL